MYRDNLDENLQEQTRSECLLKKVKKGNSTTLEHWICQADVSLFSKFLPSPSICLSSSSPASFYSCSSPFFPLFPTTSPSPLPSGERSEVTWHTAVRLGTRVTANHISIQYQPSYLQAFLRMMPLLYLNFVLVTCGDVCFCLCNGYEEMVNVKRNVMSWRRDSFEKTHFCSCPAEPHLDLEWLPLDQ